MPYDVLVKEAEDLTEDEIVQVLDYIAFLRFKSAPQNARAVNDAYDGWLHIPGQHGKMFEVLDGFDDPITDFEEYM